MHWYRSNRWLGIVALVASVWGSRVAVAGAAGGDWAAYMNGNSRSGFNSGETIITSASASNLKLKWTSAAPQGISAQPLVVNGLVYAGGWDGYERATTLTGQASWATFLGQTTSCGPATIGVVSTGTVATVPFRGKPTSVLFVGGGDAQFYALNARSGKILWHTRLGSSPDNFVWSSPAVYNGSVYIGLASFGDCPVTQGKVLKLDALSGTIQSSFDVVPPAPGCSGGGGVWGSPTIDVADGVLYVATGTPSGCSGADYSGSVVELRLSDMAALGSWQVAPADRVDDGDFGSAPTLFSAKVGSTVRRMVAIVNKNGTYYAFGRNQLNAGPVWQTKIDVGGANPQGGMGSIVPSAWDGQALYVAGGNTTINGVSCQGSLRSLQPGNGSASWETCFTDGPVLGSVTAAPGIAVVGEGNYLVVIDTTSGSILFKYFIDNVGYGQLYGPATIAHGVLYQGSMAGVLYAFGL